MNGITNHQAEQLLKQYGLNVIEEQKKKPIYLKLFEQFNNFLTILLLLAACLSFLISEPIDGALILMIVILNGLFGFYQEYKAEESLASLKNMTVTKVRVIRDGKESEIDSKFIVPRDLIFLEEGSKVPADGVLTESHNLEINESILTGESMPVIKAKGEEVSGGTVVSRGRGYFKVTHTGMQTKFGQIAQKLTSIDEGKTPLQKKLMNLTRIIGIVGIGIATLVFVLSVARGEGYFPGFLLAISLAVAIVPEGLSAVMSVTMAIGVKEMAKRKAIIRKLDAIETLGNVTLIATDKTGTLTTNKMEVKEVISDALPLLYLDSILCSTASIVPIHDTGKFDVLGDPTEGAIIMMAQKAGFNPEMVKKEWELIDEEPFDSVTKRMSVIVKIRNPKSEIRNPEISFTKGAPESILEICKLTLEEKEKIEKQVEEWGRKGLRVLAFAYKNFQFLISNSQSNPKSQNSNDKNNLDFVFLGLVAIHDAPRPEAAEAVAKAKKAGIKVVMITGDNAKTAEAIGSFVGILEKGDEIMTGSQIEEYSDQELMDHLTRVKIIARAAPLHKYRIVKLFQEMGEIVAVTGDGVNDAVALKQADVGVAMGLVGTDVARETSDMVITDDNFATIVAAIEEGRNIVKNLKNAITYLLSCNFTEALVLVATILLGLPAIFYPLQFLYINLITDGLPALSLAFSPRNKKIMENSLEKETSLINGYERKYILFVGLVSTFLILGVFYFYQSQFGIGVARTATFTVLTLIQSFILIDLWLSHRSIFSHKKHLISPFFIPVFLFPFICQFFIVRSSTISSWFKISPVSIATYAGMILFSGLILVGIKVVKKVIK